jgi:calcium-dependent protein kinase
MSVLGLSSSLDSFMAQMLKTGPPSSRAPVVDSKAISGPTIEKLRELSDLLSRPDEMSRKAEEWVRAHDVHRVGTLGVDELKILCTKLNAEFGMPPIDERTVIQLIRKFDTNDDGRLDMTDFQSFYNRLLLKIRDHYGYVKVKRDFFLAKSHGKPSDWYRVKKTIGQGSFGIVQLVEDKRAANRVAVMKTISKAKSNLSIEILEQEIRNMKRLDHPNVIKLLEYFDDAQNIYILMENADGGELLKVIEDNYKNGRYVNERWAMEIFKQVLEALNYCHAHGVMHKDLKPENIMLLNTIHPAASGEQYGVPHVLVIDFGLAEMFDVGNDPSLPLNGRSRICSGSPSTMSPEAWATAVNRNISIGYKTDVYSLGCVIFQTLTGQIPVLAKTNEPNDWLRKIKLGPNWNLMRHCSPEAIDLVKKMMAIDERVRPTAKECIDHKWFKGSFRNAERDSKKPLLSDEQIKALIRYNARTSFEKAVLMKIATHSKVSELSRVNQIFYTLDRDSKGYLDKSQCSQALITLGMPRDLADQTARSLDADGNNRIEYTELVAGLLSISGDHIDNMLWTVFTSLDKDNNGYLDVHEIKDLMNQGAVHQIGLEANEEEVRSTIAAMDTDKSGTITFNEFKHYFLHRK